MLDSDFRALSAPFPDELDPGVAPNCAQTSRAILNLRKWPSPRQHSSHRNCEVETEKAATFGCGGNRKFIEAAFDSEEELERVVIANSEYLFGSSSLYLAKALIRTKEGRDVLVVAEHLHVTPKVGVVARRG
jgi:hypothetical protein